MSKGGSKDSDLYTGRSEKLLGEKGADVVVDMKSNDDRKTQNQQRNLCYWIKKWKWKVIIGCIAVCSITSVVFSMFKLGDLSLEEKEISSMKRDILQMKHQRKKFEHDIKLLFVGHDDQNENLDKLETMLHNITVTFNERINNLTTQLNTLTTEYERQVRLQEDMQNQIDAMEMDNRKKFDEFDQKLINLKQNLNNMTKAQEVLKNDLRDTRSGLQKETQDAVDKLRNELRAAQNKLESDYRATRNSQNELRANQQGLRSMLLGKISEIKNLIQTKPNAGPITRSAVGIIELLVLLLSIHILF